MISALQHPLPHIHEQFSKLWHRVAVGFLTFLLALLTYLPSAWAFNPPPLNGYIADTANKLSEADKTAINNRLGEMHRTRGHRIAAFYVGSLEGETIEDVAYATFNNWKLGEKGLDNGVLLILAPTEGKVRIETGKGVGGAITDLQAFDIINKNVKPRYSQGDYRGAVLDGATAIAELLDKDTASSGSTKQPPPKATPGKGKRGSTIGSLLSTFLKLGAIAVVILIVVSIVAIYILYRIIKAILRSGSGPSYGNYPGSSYRSNYDSSSSGGGGFIFFGGGGSNRNDDDWGGSSGGSDDGGWGGSAGGGGESGGGGASDDL